VSDLPSVDESFDRLHRAGWSVGEVATAGEWIITGTKGENVLEARGRVQAEAWGRACEQARVVGNWRAAPLKLHRLLHDGMNPDSAGP